MRYLYSLLAVTFLMACSDEIVREQAKDIPGTFPDGSVGDTLSDPTDSSVGPDDTVADIQAYALKFDDAVGDDNVSCANSVNCAIYLSYNSSRTLNVVLTGDGKPLAGRLVSFALENDPDGLGHLTAYTAYTNGSGVAGIQVKANQSVPGGFRVKASIDEPGVAPLSFDITITPKGVVPLTVVANYAGNRPLVTYTTKLYLQGEGQPDCSDLEDLYSKQTAHYQSPPTNMTQSVKFTEFVGLKDSGPQMYTVLVYALNPTGAVWAWGCDSENAEIVYGYSKTVSVDLVDIPPVYKGTYEVTSYFDFISALPDEAEPYVNLILDFFSKPTESLFGLMCMIPSDTLDEFCDFLFDEEEEPTVTGDIVMQIVDAVIVGLTKNTVWGDVISTGADVASMLQSFEMGGIITFKDQPDASGQWTEEMTEESWDTVVVKWSLDANCDPFVDEDCGKLQFSLGAIDQQGAVSGSFTANVANEWDLTIDEHPVDLKYGAILNYVIEAQLLPLMTGWEPGDSFKIDTYEEFLQYILAGKECFEPGFGKTCCEAFGEDLANQAGTIGQNLAESACDLLTELGAAYIEQQLVGLTADSGDAFVIGTAEPCAFYDSNDDMVVDGFGTKADMCKWKATIDFGSSSTTIDADFFATRLD